MLQSSPSFLTILVWKRAIYFSASFTLFVAEKMIFAPISLGSLLGTPKWSRWQSKTIIDELVCN
jgi:hypothetical protein